MLFEAAKNGNSEQLKELIDASNVNEKDEVSLLLLIVL